MSRSRKLLLRLKNNNSQKSYWPLWTSYVQMMASKRTILVKLSLCLTFTLYKLVPQYNTTCLMMNLKKKWSRLSTPTSMFRTMKMVVEGANSDMFLKLSLSSEGKTPSKASAKTSLVSSKWLSRHQLLIKMNQCNQVNKRASLRSLRKEMKRALLS